MVEIADDHDCVARSARGFDLVVVDGFDARGRATMLDLLPLIARLAAADAGTGLVR